MENYKRIWPKKKQQLFFPILFDVSEYQENGECSRYRRYVVVRPHPLNGGLGRPVKVSDRVPCVELHH